MADETETEADVETGAEAGEDDLARLMREHAERGAALVRLAEENDRLNEMLAGAAAEARDRKEEVKRLEQKLYDLQEEVRTREEATNAALKAELEGKEQVIQSLHGKIEKMKGEARASRRGGGKG